MWSLDGLEGRLKEHSEFIDSLMCLIPPKHYFKNDPNASDDEEKFQPNKKKRIPKQVLKEQKKQAKRQKLDPNNLKTVQELQIEKLHKIQQEKQKEKEQKDDVVNKEEDEEEEEDDDDEDEIEYDVDVKIEKKDSDEEQIEKDTDDEEEEESDKESQSDLEDGAESDEDDKNKIITESRKKNSSKIQPVPDRLARIILSKRLADTNTDSSKKEKRKKLIEIKKKEKKLKQKQSKMNKDSDNQIKSEEKNLNLNEDTNKGGVAKNNGDIKKGVDIKKSGSVKRKIGDDDIEEDSLQDNGLTFAKFDFAEEKKKKKKIDDVHLKVKLQDKIIKVGRLKKLDPEKAAELQVKEAWDKAFLKAQGEKVKDDPKLLAKTIKKKIIKKRKSEKAWEDRIESVEKSMAERQKTRTENIKARIDAKNKKKKNKRK